MIFSPSSNSVNYYIFLHTGTEATIDVMCSEQQEKKKQCKAGKNQPLRLKEESERVKWKIEKNRRRRRRRLCGSASNERKI